MANLDQYLKRSSLRGLPIPLPPTIIKAMGWDSKIKQESMQIDLPLQLQPHHLKLARTGQCSSELALHG